MAGVLLMSIKNRTLKEYIDKIEDMLLDESYSFSEEFLKRILTCIKKNEHVTPGQSVAIDNVLKSRPESPTYKEWWT